MKTDDLMIVAENGKMTNMASFIAKPSGVATCGEHGPTCERIVKMETQMTGVQEKVNNIDRKQDRFFWALLCGLAGIVLTLAVAVINMALNDKMLSIIGKLHQ